MLNIALVHYLFYCVCVCRSHNGWQEIFKAQVAGVRAGTSSAQVLKVVAIVTGVIYLLGSNVETLEMMEVRVTESNVYVGKYSNTLLESMRASVRY